MACGAKGTSGMQEWVILQDKSSDLVGIYTESVIASVQENDME